MDKKTDEEWKTILTPQQYHVCRQCGTEPPFSGELLNNHELGSYHCTCCGSILFDSETKFDSGSGWPSFWQTHQKEVVIERLDTELGMVRREIICATCHAHLGHVFEDGPKPTGLRYCINSIALKFVRKENDI